MTFPDKLSDAGKEQLARQIDFFQALTTRAFENAERILALNLQTTRAALDQTSGAVRQLADVRDPRDLLALTGQTQQQVEAAMAYSRKLFEIANQPAKTTPAPEEHIDTAPPVKVSEPVAAAAPVPEAAAEPVAATLDEPAEPAEPAPAPAASAILPSKHPMGEADPEPAPAITAKARPIAKAAGKVAAAPVDTPHPAASPMPAAGPIIIPAIAPVDAVAPPPEATAPPEPKRAKGGKKR